MERLTCRFANKKLQSELTEAQEFVTKTLLYRQNKENDRIQSLEDAVERLMYEKRQLEQELEHRTMECREEAQATVAKEQQELQQKNQELERENLRLVKQMHGLGQATAEADDARLVAEHTLRDVEAKFVGQLEELNRQVKELKAAAKASSGTAATVVLTKSTLQEQVERLVGPL